VHPHHPSELQFDVKPMPLYDLLLRMTGSSPLVCTITGFLFVALISFLLVNFNTSVFFISERTFLPALIYVLLASVFPRHQILSPVLPAVVFLLLAIHRIMDSYRLQGTAFTLFDAGMLLGVGSLFFASLIWFGFLLIIGIAILRTWNLKEILISFIGIATPVFIIYGFLYVTGSDMRSLLDNVSYNLFVKESSFTFSAMNVAVLILTGIIISISVVHLLSAINSKKIKSRKTFILLFWTMLITGIVYFFAKPVSVEIYWLAAIPPTYFLSHYFVFSRKKILPEIMLIALFVLSALVQVLNFHG
jgi:hypothetical protein